jgi:O-antigen/teichoic acid export membrane protein
VREWVSARRHVGALAWTGLDQAFSALSNVVVSLAIARGAGASGLGAFTVVLSAYLLVLGFQRALIADPLLASPPTIGDRDAERAALGAAAIFSAIGSLPVLGVGVVLGRPEFFALAVVLPFVCVQDLLRYLAFRRLHPRTAVALDLVWTFVSVGAWWLIRAGSVSRAVLLWGTGGALGVFLGFFLLRLAPAGVRASWRWWKRDARVFGIALAIEGIAYTLSTQASVFIVAGALGNADLGLLRAAQILLAPSAPVLAAFSAFALPRMARRAAQLTRRDSQIASVASLALAAPVALAALMAAQPLTRLLYGSSVVVPHRLLLPVALVLLVSAAGTGPILSLKARRRGGPLVSARVGTGVLGLVFVTAALSAGVTAVAWAGAAQALVYSVTVWALEMRASATSIGDVTVVAPRARGLSGGRT